MNLSLIEPFLAPYPQWIECTLFDTHVLAVYFNRQGTHLAGCCSHGHVVVWDVPTMTILRALQGHGGAVTCASWSECGRYLASGGNDWKCLVWDIATEKVLHTFQFDVPVVHVAMHPFDSTQLLVSLAQSTPPVHIDTARGSTVAIPEDGPGTLAVWDPYGAHVWTGTAAGWWRVWPAAPAAPAAPTAAAVCAHNLRAGVRHFAVARRNLAITLADKTIAMFHLLYDRHEPFECVALATLHDPVNRHAWSACAFTPSTSHLVAASTGHTHVLHVWSKETGTLVTLLEGPAEPILHFTWHPTLPCCVTVSPYGTLSVWGAPVRERWTAYEPGFEEIEENVEYVEREDEFDRPPPAPAAARASPAPRSPAAPAAPRTPVDLHTPHTPRPPITVRLDRPRPSLAALAAGGTGDGFAESKKRRRGR